MKIKLITAIAFLAYVASPLAIADEPVWDANKVVLKAQKLRDGVYAMVATGADELSPKGVPLATTSGIIVGNRASLVVDTMLNKRLANMVLNQVRQLTKGAPTYALNTSYHGDHSYGNMYFPKSTVIIQHEETKKYISTKFEDDTKFMMGAFGKGRGIEEIKPRTGDVLIPTGGAMQLDLGGRVVEIRDFGFAQTGGDLWVWVPDAKVLFAGNPVVTEKPGIPWLLDGRVQETLDSLTKVREFLPADAIIVPGHGRPLPKAGLDWHIGYLTALRDETKAAIAKGATLEQAVTQVTLPSYQGYAIYGWVHNQVNVPAAYKEFKK
ncbi:MBL fold metallo-hydrolase [Paucibacter sp. M5-1]|uniref:MBL fold metallo-hydrolase n=1 Tax=Paucibacter sp. M5-1 TaxID=3015998 RepID=UPI0022B8F4A9|nr:MBL fold metallo-hydrolase [Paucibacter sp. M5-1]MCZ7880411.1 MBL fold metallo-hydrolase [Paucibacter sp. M5-1]